MLQPCYRQVRVLALVWASPLSHVSYCHHATAMPGSGQGVNGGLDFPFSYASVPHPT